MKFDKDKFKKIKGWEYPSGYNCSSINSNTQPTPLWYEHRLEKGQGTTTLIYIADDLRLHFNL